jgi:hypothetical protein
MTLTCATAGRFKEREEAYNRMRSERSKALQKHHEDKGEIASNKSFAERWQEREDKRLLETMHHVKARRGHRMLKRNEQKLAEISDVLHGFHKGTFHGATPGSRGKTVDAAPWTRTSISATSGLEFPPEVPFVNVEKIKMLYIGVLVRSGGGGHADDCQPHSSSTGRIWMR